MSADNNASPDLNAILGKIQDLEERCRQYENEIRSKDEKLQSFTANKSKEMKALVDGMKQWLETLPIKNEEMRERFQQGLHRMADCGEDNPIFDVLCTASEQGMLRASELERMRIENEELKKQVNGCEFANEAQRLSGTKRSSNEISSKPMDIWDEFESVMMQENGLKREQ